MSSVTYYGSFSPAAENGTIDRCSDQAAESAEAEEVSFSGAGPSILRTDVYAAERRTAPAETVLLVSRDGSSRMAMCQFFEKEKIDVMETAGSETIQRMITPETVVLLIDSALTDGTPERVCQQMSERYPDLLIIYMDEPGTDSVRRSRLARLVSFCVVKPCERSHLLAVIRQTMKMSRFVRENRSLRQTIGSPVPVTGVSAAVQTLRKQIDAFARLDNTILITGKRGTGKSTIAQQIHQSGPRAKYSFLVISCNALPPDILEVDLFGYVKGGDTRIFGGPSGPDRTGASGDDLFGPYRGIISVAADSSISIFTGSDDAADRPDAGTSGGYADNCFVGE